MSIPNWLLYTLATIGISIPFYIDVQRRGGAGAEGFNRRFRLMLWLPAMAAVGFRLFRGTGFSDIPYGLGRWPLLLVALLLPLLVEIAVIYSAVRFGWRSLSPRFLKFDGGSAIIGKDLGLLVRSRKQNIPLFSLNLLASMAIGSLFNGIWAFGQEFGWRGYLQAETFAALGPARGLMAVGLAWSAWYFPLIQFGYRYPKNPGLGGFFLMPLSTIGLSVVTGWLYVVGNSIWAPTLLHGALLVSADFSSIGLDERGEDLRVRTLWTVLWITVATLITFIWPI